MLLFPNKGEMKYGPYEVLILTQILLQITDNHK